MKNGPRQPRGTNSYCPLEEDPWLLWAMNDGLYAAVGPADQGLGPRKEGMTELLSYFPPDQTWLC